MRSDEYQLLDFGNGRRLERLGSVVLDRPCPAAEAFWPTQSAEWIHADARFEGRDQQKGQWTDRHAVPDRWVVRHEMLQFELKRTEFGHVGMFPEQAENWRWIAEEIRNQQGHVPRVLNLFAYTGGSTLAAARAGAEVVHVDAAKNVVGWARRNAELSGLADASIRWIAEDAVKFVERELKRGNRYDAVILDPPSYGHGPRGEVWRVSKDLARLLSLCRELTAGGGRFVLLTCHTPGYEAKSLHDMMEHVGFSGSAGEIEAKALSIRACDGRELPSGSVVRWRGR